MLVPLRMGESVFAQDPRFCRGHRALFVRTSQTGSPEQSDPTGLIKVLRAIDFVSTK